jgi:carboxymethylenebutenolidase
VVERWVDVATADGTVNTFVVHPDADAGADVSPAPVVLFYMDAYGQREELYDMARRIAAAGYYVMLPNLYYRSTRRFEARHGDEADIARMGELMFSIGNRMIVRDTESLLAFVDSDDRADAARIGCVGFCMSGPFVVSVAAAYPERIACAASVYGAALVTDRHDSPHRFVDRIRGELYFACAEIDEWAPPDLIERLEASLRAAGTDYCVEWYPGCHHGFAFPQRPGIYDETAAERLWQRLFALFENNLGPR